jgi:SPP1 gp7 family putative phage head morphogenesis protein
MTTVKSPFGGNFKWMGGPLSSAIGRMTRALMGFAGSIISAAPDLWAEARERFEKELLEVLVVSDLTGRMYTLKKADRVPPPPTGFAVSLEAPEPEPEEIEFHIAEVPFTEAIENIVTREPRLAKGWKAVAELYQREHAFALAKSTDLALTKKIRDVIGGALEKGFDPADQGRVIAEMGDWTRAYGETVFRTNAATAFTNGQFAQAHDPDVADLIPAFEYNAVLDSNVRPNHAAAHGLVAGTKDPIWNIFAPPNGFSCRCNLRYVDRYELERRGLMDKAGRVIRHYPPNFGNAHPDPGFEKGRWVGMAR